MGHGLAIELDGPELQTKSMLGQLGWKLCFTE